MNRHLFLTALATLSLAAVGCSGGKTTFDPPNLTTGGSGSSGSSGSHGSSGSSGSSGSGSSGSSGSTGVVDAGPCADPSVKLQFTKPDTNDPGIGLAGSGLPSEVIVEVFARSGSGLQVVGCPVHFVQDVTDSPLVTLSAQDVLTDATGHASITVSAPTTAGVAHIKANLDATTAAVTIHISGPDSGAGTCGSLSGATLGVISLTPGQIGNTNSGLNTTATLTMTARYATGANASGCTVTFTEQSGETLVSLTPTSVVVDASGNATTTITSGSQSGTAHIVAVLGGSVTTTVPLNIVNGAQGDAGPPAPTNIVFSAINLSTTHGSTPIMGIAGSGVNESGTVTFTVTDQLNHPSPGVTVAFSEPASGTLPDGGATYLINEVNASAVTDSSGNAVVSLTSNGQTGVGEIDATVLNANGVPTTLVATYKLPVRGARPSAAHFYFACDKLNLPVYTTTLRSETMSCHVSLADRFSNPIGIPTTVTFATEIGTIQQTVQTAAYDPANPGAEGTATVLFKSDQGTGFAYNDVEPIAGEPSKLVTFSNGQSVVKNPRDQLVTIIAIVKGEEQFYDANRNNTYDPGEVFIDESDPFVDANDDDLFDAITDGGASETSFSSIQNHQVPGPVFSYGNGVWDQNATLWAATHVVFSGPAVASNVDIFGNVSGVGCLNHRASGTFGVSAADDFFNSPASGTSYVAALNGTSPLQLSGSLPIQLESLGSIGLDVRQVAESDGGSCNTSNGSGCVLRTFFTGFGAGVGPLTVTNNANTLFPDGGEISCQTGSAPISVQLTVTNAHGVVTQNVVSPGSYAP
jgi:hypothetical protein